MWDYTETVMDHFRNPRNIGRIENPDGRATVGSLACGDALTFMFKLDSDGRICEAKFQTFGCASAIASSSALTEMVLGKTIDEASMITNKDIANYLGGLPPKKMHCSVMGREALEAAIKNYKTGEEEVIDVNAEITGAHKHDHDDIEEESEDADDQPTSPTPPAPIMTLFQRMKLIEKVLEEHVRPVLKQDGGDVELIEVEGDTVKIAFRGMCAGCQSASKTRDMLITAKLREWVDPNINVVME